MTDKPMSPEEAAAKLPLVVHRALEDALEKLDSSAEYDSENWTILRDLVLKVWAEAQRVEREEAAKEADQVGLALHLSQLHREKLSQSRWMALKFKSETGRDIAAAIRARGGRAV